VTGFGFYIWKRAGSTDSVTALDCKRWTLKNKGSFTQIGCDCRGASSNFADKKRLHLCQLFQSKQPYSLFTDHVHQRTHTKGHQLDAFLTRSGQNIHSIVVDPPSLYSDHSLITVDLETANVGAVRRMKYVSRRRWRTFNIDQFAADLCSSRLVQDPPMDVDDLFTCYDVTLRQLLDRHEPMSQVALHADLGVPWYDSECHRVKIQTRALERNYRSNMSSDNEKAWGQQFTQQRLLYQQKVQDYGLQVTASCGQNSKQLWSKLRCMLESDQRTSSSVNSDDLAQYFNDKIARIRMSTESTLPTVVNDRDVKTLLTTFDPVTNEEAAKLLMKVPTKQCQLDPAPTWLLKCLGDVLSPTLALMCNLSFQQCAMPTGQISIIRPLQKKPSLDPRNPASYRPISNLTFVSKLVERAVEARLTDHCNKRNLLPVYQSAYRSPYSMKTAIVRIYNDMVGVLDQGNTGVLMY
jgi:hypothetical protein